MPRFAFPAAMIMLAASASGSAALAQQSPADMAMEAATDAAALVAAGEAWKQHYEAADWDAIRTLYTDDAVLMTDSQPKLEGPDAIIGFLRRLSDDGVKVGFAFDNEEVVVDRPYGFVTAKYRMDIAFPDVDPVAVAGRSFLIYKLEDDGWKLWRDMDNQAEDVEPDDVK